MSATLPGFSLILYNIGCASVSSADSGCQTLAANTTYRFAVLHEGGSSAIFVEAGLAGKEVNAHEVNGGIAPFLAVFKEQH